MNKQLAIVGAGQAAAQAIQQLKQNEYPGEIVLIGDEEQLPYQRPPLSKTFLAGEISEERLQLRPQEFYVSNGVELRLNTRVTSVDFFENSLVLSDGYMIDFDELLFTTGAKSRQISLPGSNLQGVFLLRNISDVEKIKPQMQPGKNIAIIGAGYIGLEVAAIAKKLGLNVIVLEEQDRVLKRVVSLQMSEFFQELHTSNGIDLRVSTKVKGINGATDAEFVELSDGSKVNCDMVLIAVGSVPNDELAKQSEVKTDDGIVVNHACITSIPNVFAAGDCTRFFSNRFQQKIRLESVQNAIDQAKSAANSICGIDEIYDPVPWFWSDQFDIKLQITGLAQDYDDSIIVGEPKTKVFYIAYLKSGNLIAVDSVNHPRSHMSARKVLGQSWQKDLLPPVLNSTKVWIISL